MKTLLTLFSFLLLWSFTTAPEVAEAQETREITPEEMRSLANANRIPTRRSVNTTGSPFLYDDFHEGTITLKSGHITDSLPVRFNSHEQSIEFMDGSTAYTLDSDAVEAFEFELGDKTYTFRKGYDARRLSEEDFVEVAVDGHVQFLIRHTTSFQQNTATYGQATQEDRYTSGESYYIRVGDDDPNRIRSLRERRVMRNIDRFEDEVEAYADRHNIDFSNPEDVTHLLKYYNSLFQED